MKPGTFDVMHIITFDLFLSFLFQFIIHSALDNFEEIEASSVERPQHGPNSMWLGLLGYFDETKVYGMYICVYGTKLFR